MKNTDNIRKNGKIKMNGTELTEYYKTARQAAAEGCVLLENNGVLPFKKGERIAVFGRAALHYARSGSGSGGSVNAGYEINIADELINNGVRVCGELTDYYKEYDASRYSDKKAEWGKGGFSIPECDIPDEVMRKAAICDKALVILSRFAGEDHDLPASKGGYLLTDGEEALLKTVSGSFGKVCVCVNSTNLIDFSFVGRYGTDALLFAGCGGTAGAQGCADILTGLVCPSGRLTATAPAALAHLPSDEDYYDTDKVIYHDDVYVGYRYFESCAKELVRYPFGYGLSYTKFTYETVSATTDGEKAELFVKVKNTGNVPGKDVIFAYVTFPDNMLGSPEYALCAFGKTETLGVGREETLTLKLDLSDFALFDDKGAYEKCAFVLPSGEYVISVGESIRSLTKALSIKLYKTGIVQRLSAALAPAESFERTVIHNGKKSRETVIAEDDGTEEKISRSMPAEIPYTGDVGIKLNDVKCGKNTLDSFVAQLSAEDMTCLMQGEGMASPKVRPGTGCAFGGTNNKLAAYGIPIICGCDGPSGIRLDSGETAMMLPCGHVLAASFNIPLVEKLYSFTKSELGDKNVDVLLAPGMNIQRHVLCGRNFEYYSEDPLLSGLIGAAVTRALGGRCTIKHFAANNREDNRYYGDSVVSMRALREIYLKPYYISIKNGNVPAVMTSYNMINGVSAAGNYGLCTEILRDEWGFDGVVYSDWWTKANFRGERGTARNLAALVRAQNDFYMVSSSAERNISFEQAMEQGRASVGELQRNIKNILKYIMLPIFDSCPVYAKGETDYRRMRKVASVENPLSGAEYSLGDISSGTKLIRIVFSADISETAQEPIKIKIGSTPAADITTNGCAKTQAVRRIDYKGGELTLSAVFGKGIKIDITEIYE